MTEQEDRKEVERIVRAAGSSFYRGMRILSPDRRHAMYAVYAFCRQVDDIADDDAPLADKLPRLQAWRERVGDLYQGRTDDALSRALALAVRRFGLRQEDFLAVIDGMTMDAEAPIVMPELATLDLYCDRVAAAVGRLSVRIFGDASPEADRVAFHLGRALQLTNILRDVAEDAARGRLYLPREWLAAAGVPADPAAALRSPRLGEVCGRVADSAHEHFAAAQQAMRACDRHAMRPARMMAASYSLILAALERRGWERVADPVRLPRWRKLWLAVRALLPA